jgi:GNAT superfamily N-acetyltransferase
LTTFTTRRATIEDVEALVQLRLQLFRETGELRDDAPLPEVIETTRAYFQEHLPTGQFLVWVAEVPQQIIGTSGLIFLEKPPTARIQREAYIMNMYTVPEWQRKGVASALLQEIIDYVRTTPARRIWLRTTEPGRRLYEKHGFVPTRDELELSLQR